MSKCCKFFIIILNCTLPLIFFSSKWLIEKKAFLKEAVENDYILFFEHDPSIECCTLQQTEKGIRMKESFTLASLLKS